MDTPVVFNARRGSGWSGICIGWSLRDRRNFARLSEQERHKNALKYGVRTMGLLLHRYRKERSRASAKSFLLPAALFLSSILAACGGSGDGVSIGSGQDQDPVVIDFPVAYIKARLPLDEQGQMQQPDVRELITFNLGANLYFRDRASPSALDINITESVLNGLGDVRDVEIAYDGSKLLFAMRGPANENLDLDDEDQPTWNIWE